MRSVKSESGVLESAARLAKLAHRLKAASRFPSSPLPALWFLTDEDRMEDPLAAARRLPPGTGIVLRHYHASNRASVAMALAAIARDRSLILLIAADPALASNVGAHGVHFPRWAVRHRAGPPVCGIITASAHGAGELRIAQAIGAHAIFMGPVFATKSHESAQGLGPVRFSALVKRSATPAIALGGITPANAARLLGSGAIGLGAIGALLPPTDN